jgi:hypothetical protein
MIKQVLNGIDGILYKKPACQISIEWVPGHKDMLGNEYADEAAKAGAALSQNQVLLKMKLAVQASVHVLAKRDCGKRARKTGWFKRNCR